jgi:hypothetical protein
MKIRVHIERLVLEGLPIDSTRGMRGALQKELTRLLAEHGLSHEFRRGGAVPHVRGGTIGVGNDLHPASLGTQVAGAVYCAIEGRK